jgi:hypothetical protein
MDRFNEELRKAAAVCCDDAGFRFCSARYWMHVW